MKQLMERIKQIIAERLAVARSLISASDYAPTPEPEVETKPEVAP